MERGNKKGKKKEGDMNDKRKRGEEAKRRIARQEAQERGKRWRNGGVGVRGRRSPPPPGYD